MRRKTLTKSAFTLLEIIVAMAILMLLAAILTPVLLQAVHRSHEAQAISNLRQLFFATEMYRTDNDGQGVYGYAYDMGMPSDEMIFSQFTKPWDSLPGTRQLWDSPCGQHPDTPPTATYGTNLEWFASSHDDDPQDPWPPYVHKLQANAVFLADSNCNDKSVPLSSEYHVKKHYGVTLSGNVITRKTTTHYEGFLVWHMID